MYSFGTHDNKSTLAVTGKENLCHYISKTGREAKNNSLTCTSVLYFKNTNATINQRNL